jgi:hypothetical protein
MMLLIVALAVDETWLRTSCTFFGLHVPGCHNQVSTKVVYSTKDVHGVEGVFHLSHFSFLAACWSRVLSLSAMVCI